MRRFALNVGKATAAGAAETGLAAMLFFESLVWLVIGQPRRQPVRLSAVAAQAMEIGIRALPIVTALSAAVGVMTAIQGIYMLSVFGAQNMATLGITLSVTREFAPLITAILVAGRSGSALTARIGTMKINQELDALTVMGINPVRYLVAPALVAMVLMVPLLTWYSDLVAILGAGVYVSADLGTTMSAYVNEVLALGRTGDIWHGLGKSVLFAVLIALVGVINGVAVEGGAEGIGRYTTRSVVQAISAIVVTDMIFAFLVTRS